MLNKAKSRLSAVALLLIPFVAQAQTDPLETFANNISTAFFAAVPYVLATIGPIFIFSLLLRFLMRKVRGVAR